MDSSPAFPPSVMDARVADCRACGAPIVAVATDQTELFVNQLAVAFDFVPFLKRKRIGITPHVCVGCGVVEWRADTEALRKQMSRLWD